MSYVSGAVTTIAAGAVTTTEILDGTVALADQANLANATVIGRKTAGTGVPEAVGLVGQVFMPTTGLAVPASAEVKPYASMSLLGQSFDPATSSTGVGASLLLTVATVYFAKIPLAGSGTSIVSVTNLVAWLNTKATSTLTHCYAGVLTSAGALVGMSVDNSSAGQNWSSTGTSPALKTHPLASGPFNVTPTGVNDFVWGVLYVGTSAGTAPKFQTVSGATPTAMANLSLTAATSRVGTLAVADTATPFAAITPSSITQTDQLIWMGIS